ncbi:hypothetical protein D9613_003190 [Agrocybe pediades]|uniref:Uncharacterized protein n=1 Tax=Agrocybe pediades TaxID=84607 RepID=A0A8H4QQB7_9AGAR|nr:hypothetical protein D9613_003190 [Agrocybe pediades]
MPGNPDFVWEKLRLKHDWAYYESRWNFEKSQIFEPGRVAVCKASVVRVFLSCVSRLGIPLKGREIPPQELDLPLRYCIVNKHIEGNTYEVFVLTTFGGARTWNDLSPLARSFGVPLGKTKWYNRTPGIATIPPILGLEKSSFIFALPTVKKVELSNLLISTRVPQGELDRLRRLVRNNLEALPQIQWEIRKSLPSMHLYKNETSSTDFDDFKPLPMQKRNITSFDDEEMVEFIAKASSKLSYKSRPIKVPDYHNISWPLRYLMNDLDSSNSGAEQSKLSQSAKSLAVTNTSDVLKPAVGRRRATPTQLSLPKPYYAPCLRLGVKAFQRIIR